MPEIISIHARQIFDSRANPTIEVEVEVQGACTKAKGIACAPSGASTGTHEAHELRDGGPAYHGRSVFKAIECVNGEIFDLLSGQDASNQLHIDHLLCTLDGSNNKTRLGANAILATSLAVAKASANAACVPLWRYLGGMHAHVLPVPLMNIINGGAHADNALDIQEFMIMPIGASSFTNALQIGSEVYHHLKNLLKKHNLTSNVGDEGGFSPNLNSTREALDLLLEAISIAGFKAGKDIFIALDCAASEYYEDGFYVLKGENKKLSREDNVAWLEKLAKDYPIFSIEDGCSEDDWQGWQLLQKKLGDQVQLIGDDLFVTNPKRIQKGFTQCAANSVLIKPNQIGTLTETMQTIAMTQHHGWKSVISHRSGETEDTFIADLCVATNAGQAKFGAMARSERTAKYNRLLRIEEDLANNAVFAGKAMLQKI